MNSSPLRWEVEGTSREGKVKRCWARSMSAVLRANRSADNWRAGSVGTKKEREREREQ